MKTTTLCIICLAAVVILGSVQYTWSRPVQGTTIALVTRIIQEVMTKSAAADWKAAVRGEALVSGDRIRTGKRSLAIVKFTDNSLLRIRAESELALMGTASKESFPKNIELRNGGFGFDVKKQQNEEFKFTSPTSVASIRGTKGSMIHGPTGDTLIVTEGLVNLRNTTSGEEVDVGAGFIGFSDNDGRVSSRPASEQELSSVNRITNGVTPNELDLRMRNNQGKEQDLKLKYKR